MFSFFKKKYQSINITEFKELQNDNEVVVIDVRNTGELSSGIIPKSIHINVMESSFAARVKELDRTKTYVMYCRSGLRSARACQIMAQNEFKDLYNLKGGIIAWVKAR
jgi:rhodanese-related sulfurtransferase|tara:strand:+ start:890 stop:1213 length:324 start_codon:yes stop_codon:yes gene_type:complete